MAQAYICKKKQFKIKQSLEFRVGSGAMVTTAGGPVNSLVPPSEDGTAEGESTLMIEMMKTMREMIVKYEKKVQDWRRS